MGILKCTARELLICFHYWKATIVGYYGEGVIISQDGNLYTAEISLMNNMQGYNSLFLLGEHCECLEPPHVRKYLMDKAAAILSVYKK
jgi:predicted DNA-binding transcriptional regulator YafY